MVLMAELAILAVCSILNVLSDPIVRLIGHAAKIANSYINILYQYNYKAFELKTQNNIEAIIKN